jgi:hypothetical protein
MLEVSGSRLIIGEKFGRHELMFVISFSPPWSAFVIIPN